MDLATLLKPILTAGGLRVVGSTTFDEYKQIEKDRALSRRFQKVVLQEPSIEETVRILQEALHLYPRRHRPLRFPHARRGAWVAPTILASVALLAPFRAAPRGGKM